MRWEAVVNADADAMEGSEGRGGRLGARRAFCEERKLGEEEEEEEDKVDDEE